MPRPCSRWVFRLASCTGMIGLVGRGDLSDEQWAVLESLLPAVGVSRRSPGRRRLVDGVRWRVRTGVPWRDLPREYGPWQTVYGLFRRWQRRGVWARLLTLLQAQADAAGLITWEINVDSTVCRAHRYAAGARRNGAEQKEPPGGVGHNPGDHGLGRSRGGFTTMIHLTCEQGQKPLSLLVTAGQRGDSPQFEPVLNAIRVPRPGAGRPRTRPLRVRGDRAYSSRANRAYLRRRGIRCTIPEPAGQARNRKSRGRTGGRPPAVDWQDYKARHAVECVIGRLKVPEPLLVRRSRVRRPG
ncbi:IS5 family transposase [Streptomyces sp. NPDC127129]|uniref:IS5 family transposase n=1 Tax=Streptomyces sp. NPDC127129 TaxID=3345373 RepID=UPI00363C80B1